VELSFNGVRLPVRVEQKRGLSPDAFHPSPRQKGGKVINRVRCSAQALCVAFAIVLAACGGGGGGGSSGGSDPSTASGLTVSPTSISFTAVQSGAIPPTQNIQITISRPDAVAIVVGFPPSVTPPTWLDQSSNRFSCTPSLSNCTLTAAILTTLLAPGTYATTLRFAITDAGHNILALRDVQMSYAIQPLVGLAASPQSLSFGQLQGAAAPATQTLGISDIGNASYAWNASVIYQSGSGWLNINGAASASGATLPTSLSISVNASGTLGTLNAIVRVTGNGYMLDVPVSHTVSEPTLTRSTASLVFNAPSHGVTPATQDVTLSTQGSLPLNYTTSVTYEPGAAGWLTVPANGTAPGAVTVSVNTTDLAPGIYFATLFVNTAAQTVAVGVTYAVASPSLTFSPASASFTINTASLPAALSQSVGVGSTGAALNWTAASSQPWVTILPTSGSSGSTVTLSLDPVQLDALDPGLHSATISFSYTPPGGSLTSTPLTVSLNLLLPKVTSVTPYVATSGTSREVILRGLGFNSAAGADLKFGGSASVPATGYTVLSDTEIRVTHPSLTAGPALRVSIANQLGNPGIVRSTADLVVVDAPVYAATTIAYPNATAKRPLNIIYDAERQALVVGVAYSFAGPGDIFRYPFASAAWQQPPTTLSVPTYHDLALSLDGKNLFAVLDLSINQLDSVTLAPGPSANSPVSSPSFLAGMTLANDNNAVVTIGLGSGFTGTYRYSIRDRSFVIPIAGDWNLLSAPTGAASADRSRIVLIQSQVSPAQNIYQYTASNGLLSHVNLPLESFGTRPALDRSATRMILSGSLVYNGNFQKLGNIPFSSTVALSPDGSKAYAYSSGTVLRTYDLTGTLANPDTDAFPEIGTTGTPLPSDPGLPPGVLAVMTVSPDGGTLFIAGSDGIVVVPAP